LARPVYLSMSYTHVFSARHISQNCVEQWSGTDSSPLSEVGVQDWLYCSTDKNKIWRQSLLCGRPSCMEQSTSSSSWSWWLVFDKAQAQNTSVYVLMTVLFLQTFVMHSWSCAE